MRRVTVAAVLVLSACSSPSAIQPGRSPSAPTAARDRMSSVRSYVVYYGAGRLDDLARFDLAIIDPSTLTPTEVGELEARGTLVVGYLSVGEISPNDPWITDGTVPRSWILGRNRNWGSLFVDAGQQGWRDLMTAETGKLLDYGFDGVFLDTVDTATDVEPTSVPGMISLIEGLRTAYPDALLVQNRGFDIAEQVAGSIDAVMFEDLSTSYDFDNLTYLRVDNSDEADRMVELRERTGLPILSLDYAPPEDHATAARAVRIARGYGFVPAVSTIELDDIPDYGLGPAS
jgi:uncharacterized protein (TIGR01370 family)